MAGATATDAAMAKVKRRIANLLMRPSLVSQGWKLLSLKLIVF
jgi:hypothetical protein